MNSKEFIEQYQNDLKESKDFQDKVMSMIESLSKEFDSFKESVEVEAAEVKAEVEDFSG